MANIVYRVHAKFKGSDTRPMNFYEKEKAIEHKIEMKNLGFSKVYIKKRNMQ